VTLQRSGKLPLFFSIGANVVAVEAKGKECDSRYWETTALRESPRLLLLMVTTNLMLTI